MGLLNDVADKVMAGTILVLILIGGGLGFAYKHQIGETREAQSSLKRVQADLTVERATTSTLQAAIEAMESAFKEKQAEVDALEKRMAEQKGNLQDAIDKNPTWSSGSVPDAVIDGVWGPIAPGPRDPNRGRKAPTPEVPAR